jgi:multidrug transporter EmrE-like cation transporter
MSPLLLILASVLLGVVGQLLIKTGLNRIGPLLLKGQGVALVAWRVGMNPLIWGGLGLYAVSTLFWVVALSRVELGYAYPFISLSYVLILLASWALFREAVSLTRLLGVAAICLGIVVIATG